MKGGANGLPQSKMLLDILKKLYKKNVELVKENQILKQQLSATKKKLIETESLAKTTNALSSAPLANGGNGNAKNIKSSMTRLKSTVKSRETARGGGTRTKDSSTINFQREPLQKTLGSQVKAGKLMNELNFRLNQEQKQRDIETAIYNAQLYEYEKKEVDWFVEKKYLEEKIVSLEEEVQKRNALDDQIENCILMLQNKMATEK